jgi:hemolysin activation/secretion protein
VSVYTFALMLPTTVLTAKRLITATIICVGISQIRMDAMAANPVLPGPADAGRVDQDHKQVIPEVAPTEEGPSAPSLPGTEIPEAAKNIKFTLRQVKIVGATAFPASELAPLYQPYLNKEVSLDTIWKIAGSITERYQNAGYFLSRAFIPKQEINDGVITIRVVEGYVAEVELKDPIADNYVIEGLMEDMMAEKPAKSQTMESLLLRLNDLPGVSFRSVIQPLQDKRKDEGAVKLLLITQKKQPTGTVSFDNYNSRYLGPYEGTAAVEASLLPLQQTSLSALIAVPEKKLSYFNGSQIAMLTSEISVQLYGGYTAAHPGFTLSSKDIDSDASNLGVSLKDQFIRQRQENLSATLSFDGKNNYSDILDAPLTRDRVRAARANVSYDRADPLDGYDFLNLTFSQGIPVLGSSTKGQEFLSRAGASPDFDKLEYGLTRFQTLPADFTVVTGLSGQIASGVLYSPEQFGFGGQAFGRAYDPSEILGDNGIAGSVELRYLGIPAFDGISTAPYAFYDVGKVWDDGQPSESGSSAGGGIRLDSIFGMSGIFTIAEPLTRRIEHPSSGNGKSPRYLFQMSYKLQPNPL